MAANTRLADEATTGRTFADPAEVESFAQSLSDSFLLCREMGHNWRPHTAKWAEEEKAYERVIRCSRCRTLRVQWLSDRGSMLSSHYVYAEGYQHKGGRMTGEGRDVLRLESVLRLVNKDG